MSAASWREPSNKASLTSDEEQWPLSDLQLAMSELLAVHERISKAITALSEAKSRDKSHTNGFQIQPSNCSSQRLDHAECDSYLQDVLIQDVSNCNVPSEHQVFLSESALQEHDMQGNCTAESCDIEIDIKDDISEISSFQGETADSLQKDPTRGSVLVERKLSRRDSEGGASGIASSTAVSISSVSGHASKRKEREQRFAIALRAQLRSEWTMAEDSHGAVPRWSQCSNASFLSLQSADFPSLAANYPDIWHDDPRLRKGESWLELLMVEKKRANCVIHPQSPIKIIMDVLGIVLMLYDFVTTPLQFFELPESKFLSMMGWVTRIFWIVDIWINFHTATFVKGVLTTEVCQIARQYLRNMFLPDLLIVAAEWTAYFYERSNQSFQNIVLLRILKALRFAKVMRIFKLEHILAEFKAQINSTYLLLLLRPMVLIVGLLFFNHMIACFWYGIGTSSSTGWTSTMIEESRSNLYLYFTALHWAMSMLHGNVDIYPRNAQERIFQCSMTVLALVMFSTLLSSITNAMVQIHALRQHRFEQQSQLREILARRQISAGLTARIKKRLDHNAKTERCRMESDEIIIKRLPTDLVNDFFFESRSPLVNHHYYFFMLGYRCPRILRQLCTDAIDEVSNNQPDETIFSAGDAGHAMFFVDRGELEYVACQSYKYFPCHQSFSSVGREVTAMRSSNSSLEKPKETAVQLERRDYLCEPVLWMTWEYCGGLVSRTPVQLLSVNARRFCEVVQQFHFAQVNSARYAVDFLERMVRAGRRSDLALPQ